VKGKYMPGLEEFFDENIAWNDEINSHITDNEFEFFKNEKLQDYIGYLKSLSAEDLIGVVLDTLLMESLKAEFINLDLPQTLPELKSQLLSSSQDAIMPWIAQG
jgi:hypothetical protein